MRIHNINIDALRTVIESMTQLKTWTSPLIKSTQSFTFTICLSEFKDLY
jgi:hypothetical protein